MIIDKTIVQPTAPESSNVLWLSPEERKIRYSANGEWVDLSVGNGTDGAPIFDAEITEESERIVVSMSSEDKRDIYSHKYPIVGIHLIDEEENDVVLYFKIRIESAEANAIVYDNWDGGDGGISQMELTFMWDSDDVKVVFDTNDYSGEGLEYATNAEIDALFNSTPTMATITFDLTSCHAEIDGESISSGHQVPIGQPLEIAIDGDYLECDWDCMILTMNGQDISNLFDGDGNPASIEIPSVTGDIYMEIECVDVGEDPVPIESIRYTDGSGNTCVGFNMLLGETVDLCTNLEILPDNYTDGVEFISDDDGIIQVDGGGMATATGEVGDSTTITISSMENPNIFTTVNISIAEEEPEEEEE